MVPYYIPEELHAILMRGAHAARMEVQPNYPSVMRLATARPDEEDPGEIVNSARRMRAGKPVNQDRASTGF